MKIWVIGRNIPTTHNRMNGSFELDQAKMLAEGNDVSYLAQSFCFGPGRNNRTPGYFFRNKSDGSVRIISRTCFYFPGRFGMHWKSYLDLQWMTFVRQALRKTGIPDIVHVHYPAMIGNVKVLEYLKSLGAKLVCTEHWSMVLLEELDVYQRDVLCRLVEISDAFACAGQPLADAVKTITRTSKDILVIPNAVSELFRPSSMKSSNRSFRFVVVGRLVPMKQFDKVIEAFAAAFGEDDDSTLLIVGDGQEKNHLMEVAHKTGVEERVTMAGALSRGEVAVAVAGSDCLVCYSEYETFGATIIEGWACGLPVIASDGLGSSSYWRDGLGVVVDHRATTELVSAMRSVRSSYSQYNSQFISAYAVSTFGNDAIRNHLMGVYEGLLEPSDEDSDKTQGD